MNVQPKVQDHAGHFVIGGKKWLLLNKLATLLQVADQRIRYWYQKSGFDEHCISDGRNILVNLEGALSWLADRQKRSCCTKGNGKKHFVDISMDTVRSLFPIEYYEHYEQSRYNQVDCTGSVPVAVSPVQVEPLAVPELLPTDLMMKKPAEVVGHNMSDQFREREREKRSYSLQQYTRQFHELWKRYHKRTGIHGQTKAFCFLAYVRFLECGGSVQDVERLISNATSGGALFKLLTKEKRKRKHSLKRS